MENECTKSNSGLRSGNRRRACTDARSVLPGLDVVGITVVCGNVPVEKGVKNALKILELMNRTEIGVYAGEETPLIRPYVDAMDTHGRDGLGESG